jgi:predicted nucleotidyltransferase
LRSSIADATFRRMENATQARFTAALDALVDQLRQDRSVLAAILCGSLSYDRVWSKSDIDLVLVTIDDRKADRSDIALYADGLNVHAFLMRRAEFRRAVEGSFHNSFVHSFLARGRLLYTHDETIATLCGRLHDIGAHDTQLQLLRAATHALGPVYKARKWFVTRGDLDYTALWILYAVTALARIEVIAARRLADREVIPQALALNPAFFKLVYTDLLNTKKTKTTVQAALDAVDAYIATRRLSLFAPVIDYLREVGEPHSASEIEAHFTRQLDVEGVTTACEYLADEGLIGKASTPARLTKKSRVDVQELAFYYIDTPSHVG